MNNKIYMFVAFLVMGITSLVNASPFESLESSSTISSSVSDIGSKAIGTVRTTAIVIGGVVVILVVVATVLLKNKKK